MAKKSKHSKVTPSSKVNKKSKPSNNNSTNSSPSSPQTKLSSTLISPLNKNLQSQLYNATNLRTLVPNAVFCATNFFTESECKAWITKAESEIGFQYVNHPATRYIAQRECGRIQETNWDIAEQLFQRMQHFEMMKKINPLIGIDGSGGYLPMTCNGNIRIYKYEKGMSFGKHVDGSDRIPEVQNGNTEITVLVYLSSCLGGATRFYLPFSKNKSKSSKNKEKSGISFVPQAGAILFHVHGDRCLEHEADPVLSGIKYVLRTDIVYGNAYNCK